jgi:serine/threonine protein kinase
LAQTGCSPGGYFRAKLAQEKLIKASPIPYTVVRATQFFAGTPLYMSPEQAAGEPFDHRSDLFSLGSVLYALCTGRPPFRAGGTHAVLKRVIADMPRPIREVNPQIPGWLCDLIARLHA